MKRRIFAALGAAVLMATLSQSALAQADSGHPIRLIVPYSPGGIADTMARLLAKSLAPVLKQPVIVDNKPGANTSIGAIATATSPGDGNTLLVATGGTVVLNPLLYPALRYQPEKDFASVAGVAVTPLVITVRADSPIGSVDDLVRLAKAEPGKYAYATQGLGSTSHLAMELLQSATSISLNHVPYGGSGQSLNAVASGTVQMSIDAVASAMPLIKANKLRAIAVSTNVRSAFLPQVPTLAETVAPGYDVWVWYGIMVPASTPASTVARLNQAIVNAVADKQFSEPLVANGLVMAKPMTASAFNDSIRQERATWRKLIEAKKITLN